MSDPAFHEVCTLFPQMSEAELSELAEDIKQNGLREPIWLHSKEKSIIDGRNRYLACQRAGVEPKFRTWIDKGSLVGFVLSLNLNRRHLTTGQKTALGLEIEPMLAEEAKKRQGVRTNIVAILPQCSEGKSRDQAAKRVGVGGRYISDLKKAVSKAPELLGEVKRGAINVQEARHLADMPKDKRGAVVKKVHSGKKFKQAQREVIREAKVVPVDFEPLPERCTIFCGDLFDVSLKIPENSVDAIITDPPYPRDFIPEFEKLANVAARCLKPGGSLLVMSGQSYLPEIFEALKHDSLRYQWTVAYLTKGGQSAQIWPRKVNTFWKPVIWIVKGEYTGDWVGDVTKSAVNDNDKRFHEWGQSESGMADLIERFTYPGQTILDPFLGGGTTGVVSVKMARIFIGIDAKQDAVDTAKARLAVA